ncbi:MAG: type I-E CRISPR-associated protein Cas6/Cse3/CasE [Desulfuromonadales bacterium]|nr:type I-E CRISPR-associated protein Cas6/Cse3/CasE [Desulfuromonadales bacterium]
MYFSRIRVRPDVRDLHLLISGNGYGAHQMMWKLFPANGEGRTFLFREEVAREQIPFHKGVKGEPVFYAVSAAPPLADHPVFTVESKPYAPRLATGDRLAFRLRANPTIARKADGKKNSVRHDVVMDSQRILLHDLAQKLGLSAGGEKSALKRKILTAWDQSESVLLADDLRAIVEGGSYREAAEQSLAPALLLELALKTSIDMELQRWLTEKGTRNGFALVRDEQKDRLKFQAEGYQWHALPKKGKTAGFSSVDFEGELEVVDPDQLSEALFCGLGSAKGFGCGLMLVRRV